MSATNYKALLEAANNHKDAPFIEKVQPRQRPTKMTDAQLVSAQAGGLDAKASEFALGARNQIAYMHTRKVWLYFDGHVWKVDEGSVRVRELVKDYGRSFAYPEPNETDEQKSARKRWLRELTVPKGINAVLELIQTDALLSVYPQDFDVVPDEINTPGGIVNLRTTEVTPTTADNLVMRSTTVTPDASCPTPLYDQLLSEAFPGRPELAQYFEDMMGVSLVKGQTEQVFVYMFGAAGSGKGTLMNIAQGILGSGDNGYTVTVDSDLFVRSRSQQHPTEMMQFLGARMAISSEVTKGAQMDTGKLKRLTGGDRIKGRYMGKDFVEYDATHTLWIMANDRLEVPSGDNGVWRRLRVLPFDFAKREAGMIGNLDKMILASEAQGILARWIAAASKYLEEGLSTPEAVNEAREEYKRDADTVAEWLQYDCTTDPEVGGDLFAVNKAARESYVAFCKREKRIALGLHAFNKDLASKGIIVGRRSLPGDGQVRGYVGMRLN